MSKAPQRGKLRNPPRGRQYAFVADRRRASRGRRLRAYLYATHRAFYVYGSSTSDRRRQTASTSRPLPALRRLDQHRLRGRFNNTPCTPSTTTPRAARNGTYALICTNLGLIEVQLFPADAPQTVANFVKLANSGFYNDLVWHRIVPGFVIQAGDPNTKNGGGNRSTWGAGRPRARRCPLRTRSLTTLQGP